MSRFSRLIVCAMPSFFVTATNIAQQRKNNDVKKITETARDSSGFFSKNPEKYYHSIYAASQVAPVLPEIRELTVNQLAEYLNYWQDSSLSLKALYEKTSETQFKPVRVECYNDCIIAFMQLQEFRRKYEAQLQLQSTPVFK